jgi:hypothetical protein
VIAAYDHDAILNDRDSDADFEAQWVQCYNQIENQWRTVDVKQEVTTLIEAIYRESFLSVSRATKQHEISSYVSDDFDLIVRGAFLGMTNDFLTSLWDAYNRGKIPSPQRGK